MTDYPGLVFSENENQLVASLRPSLERTALDLDGLREALARAGYGQWQLADEALATLLASYNLPGAELDLTIGERRDASYSLEIAPDALRHEALEWATTRGSRSGRTAWQYIQDLAGRLGQRLEG